MTTDLTIEEQVAEVAAPPTVGVAQPYTPPKKGWKTSQFWVMAASAAALGALVYYGVLTIEQARGVADMFGISWFGIVAVALGAFGYVTTTYVKGRNEIALARQEGFTELTSEAIASNPTAMAMGLDWKKLGKIIGKVDTIADIAGKFGVPHADKVGSVADIVERIIMDPKDPSNERALQALAARMDQQDKQLAKIMIALRIT